MTGSGDPPAKGLGSVATPEPITAAGHCERCPRPARESPTGRLQMITRVDRPDPVHRRCVTGRAACRSRFSGRCLPGPTRPPSSANRTRRDRATGTDAGGASYRRVPTDSRSVTAGSVSSNADDGTGGGHDGSDPAQGSDQWAVQPPSMGRNSAGEAICEHSSTGYNWAAMQQKHATEEGDP